MSEQVDCLRVGDNMRFSIKILKELLRSNFGYTQIVRVVGIRKETDSTLTVLCEHVGLPKES